MDFEGTGGNRAGGSATVAGTLPTPGGAAPGGEAGGVDDASLLVPPGGTKAGGSAIVD